MNSKKDWQLIHKNCPQESKWFHVTSMLVSRTWQRSVTENGITRCVRGTSLSNRCPRPLLVSCSWAPSHLIKLLMYTEFYCNSIHSIITVKLSNFKIKYTQLQLNFDISNTDNYLKYNGYVNFICKSQPLMFQVFYPRYLEYLYISKFFKIPILFKITKFVCNLNKVSCSEVKIIEVCEFPFPFGSIWFLFNPRDVHG